MSIACVSVQSGQASVENEIFTSGHPVEHGGGDAVTDAAPSEKALQIVQDDLRNVMPHLPICGGDVRRDDRPWQAAQGVIGGQRFERVRHIESATESSTAYFPGQSFQIDEAAACDVDNGGAVRQACKSRAMEDPASFFGKGSGEHQQVALLQ